MRVCFQRSLSVKKVVSGILSLVTVWLLIVSWMSNVEDHRYSNDFIQSFENDTNVNAKSIPNDKVKFRTIPKSQGPCVTKEKIESFIEMTNTFHIAANIRVFPRNGFLLGIIRHGGFLPNERNIDPDLAVMFEDISNINSQPITSNQGTKYSFKRYWTHKNPFGGKAFNAEYLDITSNDGKSFEAACFYPYGLDEQNAKHVYYPFYVSLKNREGSLKDAKRWNTKGAQNIVVGPGNEDRELDREALGPWYSWTTGIGHLFGWETRIGTLFDAEWFDTLIPMPFYHSEILVPRGYDKVLRSYYGDEYMNPEQRNSKYESLRISTKRSQEFIDNGPLPMCE